MRAGPGGDARRRGPGGGVVVVVVVCAVPFFGGGGGGGSAGGGSGTPTPTPTPFGSVLYGAVSSASEIDERRGAPARSVLRCGDTGAGFGGERGDELACERGLVGGWRLLLLGTGMGRGIGGAR